MSLTPEQFSAYVAGVIDSDGCIRIDRQPIRRSDRKSYAPYVTVMWKETETTVAVCREMARVYSGTVRSVERHGRRYVIYGVARRAARKILLDTLPLLQLKAQQAFVGLRVLENTPDGRGRHRPTHLDALLEADYVECKRLNASGRRGA